MANRLMAVNEYRPRVKRGPTVTTKELAEYMSSLSTFYANLVIPILMDLHDAVVFFNRQGRSVKLDGLGIYSPKIGLDGEFSVFHRVDRELIKELNEAATFWGEIINKRMIGKEIDDLVSRWNSEHPEDPVN